jgi:septal ring factor EnvC (AmiA/AmiB activator)
MKYLTFLDYATVESIGQDYQSQLQEMRQEKDQEIENIKKEFSKVRKKLKQIEDEQKRWEEEGMSLEADYDRWKGA